MKQIIICAQVSLSYVG